MRVGGKFVRNIDKPEAGYYLRRLVRGGPWVPAAIFHDDRGWWAEVMGNVLGDPDPDPLKAEGVMTTWLTSQQEPITEKAYRARIRELRQPGAPAIDKKVDLNELPPPF